MVDRIIRPNLTTRVIRSPQKSRVIVGGRGLTGPAGSGGSAEGFDYVQPSPITPWIVNHNQGKKPIVTVFDAGGHEVEADVYHTSVNQTYIYFTSAFAGSARFV